MRILDPPRFRAYIEGFNSLDQELTPTTIPNAGAWDFLAAEIPFFECPDPVLERIYYFRWWVFRKHLRKIPSDRFVVTEFLPDVGWASKHNTISCAAGHHFREGRWLRSPRYLADNADFWTSRDAHPRNYSFWLADSILAHAHVTGDMSQAVRVLPRLIENYRAWEKGWENDTGHSWICTRGRRDGSGLFWQVDTGDGMEFSIGGHGLRPSFNSYMYGEARAIAEIATQAGDGAAARDFSAEADRLKALVQEKLWSRELAFFVTFVNNEGAKPHYDWQQFAPHIYPAGAQVDVRELIGYVPWYFNLPDGGYEEAWRQLRDTKGFDAPFGLSTAEQRHRNFRYTHTHDCLWNGEVWPFATTQTLVSLANLLDRYDQTIVTATDYLHVLRTYAASHRLMREDGVELPWIDEDLAPYTGAWSARAKILARKPDPMHPNTYRGKDYNHSGFCDLIISGLIGLRPMPAPVFRLNPLTPADWDYWCLDGVRYRGREWTIFWDRDGSRYGRGAGMTVLADGKVLVHTNAICRIEEKF